MDVYRCSNCGNIIDGLQNAEIAHKPLLLGPQIFDALQGGIAILHDVRRPALQVGHFLAMTGDRHLRPNAARRPNVGGILHRRFLLAALPFIVSGGTDVVEEPIDALPDPGYGDNQPFFELADQRVPLGFEHGTFAADWVVVSGWSATTEKLKVYADPARLKRGPLWTDEYSNLFQVWR